MTTLNIPKQLSNISKLFSDGNLSKKAYLNSIAAALDYGARVLSGLIVIPFLVGGLGDVMYGTWVTLSRMTGYLNVASGRSSQALKWRIANLQYSTDYEEKRRNVGSAVIVWALFLPIMIIVSAVLVWFAPIWINSVPENNYTIVRFAAALLSVKMILISLTAIPEAILEGENLKYKRIGLSALLVFIGGGLTILALYLNTGIAGIAVAALTTILLGGLLYFLVARSQVAWFGISKPSVSSVREFFGLSGWFLIWRLVMQLMMVSDIILLGVFTSAELVTTYSLTKYAPEMVVSFVAIVVFSITPGLGGILGAGDLEKVANVRAEIMMLTWLVITIVGATILLWNQTFLRLWVGPGHYAGTIQTLLILIMVTQIVLIRNDSSIIDLTLEINNKVLLGLLSAVVSIGLAAVFVYVFNSGSIGLILGLIAGRLILSFAYPTIIGRYLQISPFSQMKGLLRPFVVSALLILITLFLGSLLKPSALFTVDTWISFALSVAGTLVVVSILAFFLGLSRNNQNLILRRARRIISTG